jgi:hypothetical protein
MSMSTLTEEGVSAVKNQACDLLLAHRVDAKAKTSRAQSILNRLHLALPKARDSRVRGKKGGLSCMCPALARCLLPSWNDPTKIYSRAHSHSYVHLVLVGASRFCSRGRS